jgi:hypothetical protein
MEEEMRRSALMLGTVGVIALGLAGTPSQAQAQGWWGYPNWRENAWREHQRHEWAWRHHEWRGHRYWHPYY